MKEKPLECNQCKKKPTIAYKEIMHGVTTLTNMCADCPILQLKLKGKSPCAASTSIEESLCCMNCQTTLENVLLGHPLGCRECYSIFETIILKDLIKIRKIPKQYMENQANQNLPLHVGKSPYVAQDELTIKKIGSLHQSLNEALKKENYEQAAWLRDQINSLKKMENPK